VRGCCCTLAQAQIGLTSADLMAQAYMIDESRNCARKDCAGTLVGGSVSAARRTGCRPASAQRHHRSTHAA